MVRELGETQTGWQLNQCVGGRGAERKEIRVRIGFHTGVYGNDLPRDYIPRYVAADGCDQSLGDLRES